MFNDEQRAAMRSLSATPPERRCFCGWHRLDDVVQCPNCPPGYTNADKVATRVSCCGATAWRPGEIVVHYASCPTERR
jgi:hypothetical protein